MAFHQQQQDACASSAENHATITKARQGKETWSNVIGAYSVLWRDKKKMRHSGEGRFTQPKPNTVGNIQIRQEASLTQQT